MYIEELTNQNIARLLMRFLWRVYDDGGISHGRALRSRLLESVMDIVSLPKDLDPDFFRKKCLLKEAHRRLKTEERKLFQTLLFPKSLNLLSTLLIATLVLENLQAIYDEDDQLELGQRNYSYTEKELLQVAHGLLKQDLPENISLLAQSFSREDVLEEIANRYWKGNIKTIN